MRVNILLCGVLFGLTLAIGARPVVAQELEPVETGISRATLSNGLSLYVVEDRSLPLVTVEMAVRAGAWVESPDYDGLSHVYEHMFFKGNAVLPDQEAYLDRMRELGIVFNGTTGTEHVNYYFTMTSERWREGLAFMRDAMLSPLFDEAELERERQVVLDELSRNESNPYFHLGRAAEDLLWSAYPSRKNVIGSRDVIATVTRDKMLSMQSRFYVPNNAVLIVSGDVDATAVLAEAKALFGDWAEGPNPFEVEPLPVHPPLDGDKAAIVEQPIGRAVVLMQWHGPDVARDAAATYAADVLMFILGQETSVLYDALVDNGLALGAGFTYYTQQNVGPITLYFETTPDKLEPAIRAANALLETLDDESAYSEEQLTVAKILLEASDLASREQTSSFSHMLAFWWSSAGLDYYFSYLAQLGAVTRADTQRFVRDYLIGKPMVLAVMLNADDRAALELSEEKLLSWIGD